MKQTGFVHFCYSPTSGWVLQLLAHLHNSQNEVFKKRMSRWDESKLKDLGLALTSKLQIVGVSVRRVNDVVGRIWRELNDRHSEIAALINEDACLIVHTDDLLFEAILDIEAFLFEMHSALEITEAFVKKFRRCILGDPAGRGETLKDCFKRLGIDECWYEDLDRARNLFTHQSAPWLALEVESVDPQRFDLVLLKKEVIVPAREDYFHFDQCRQMYGGYFDALGRLHNWLLGEIDTVEG